MRAGCTQGVKMATVETAKQRQTWLEQLQREDARRRYLKAAGASGRLIERLRGIRDAGRSEHVAELRDVRRKLARDIPLVTW